MGDSLAEGGGVGEHLPSFSFIPVYRNGGDSGLLGMRIYGVNSSFSSRPHTQLYIRTLGLLDSHRNSRAAFSNVRVFNELLRRLQGRTYRASQI